MQSSSSLLDIYLEVKVLGVRVESGMEGEPCIPPGFRFHPTEEELVGYYLARKINSLTIDLNVIPDIDLYKMEPWDIEDRCKMGYEEQNEWYFFSHKDKKYPTGMRTNRATVGGFWKATGRDKAVVSGNKLIGLRKTLVFYNGRAPNGRKSDWIMHEYRLQSSENAPPQDEGWVVCRAFKKPSPHQRPGYEAWNNAYYLREQEASCVHNLGRQSLPPSVLDLAKPPGRGQAGETSAINQFHIDDSTILHDHDLFSNNHHRQSMEILPQLDSPLSMAYNTAALRRNNGNSIEKYYDDGGSCDIDMEGSSQRENMDYKPAQSSINSSHFLGLFPDSS